MSTMSKLTTSLTFPSLLLAMAAAAAPAAQASPTDTSKPARLVSPAVHGLQTTRQKSSDQRAQKPALPPRRPGPVLKLGATLTADDQLELRCDQHAAPEPTAGGEQP